MLHDRPIETPGADEFERGKFAQAVAAALVLPEEAPSIVVAIEGEWGSGKTSVLNMVASDLANHEHHPLVVRLESWLLAGSSSIVYTFLAQLASALGSDDKAKNAKETAEKVLKLARLLAPAKMLPGVGLVATVAQETFQLVGESAKAYAELAELDIKKRKLEVASSIRSAKRPIVIIIDDLDRLEPEEARSIFRLVKAVADFERVAYLLAYDPDPVHRALSYDGIYDGVSFLEKIVQVAYPLPAPGYWALKRFLETRLEGFLAPLTLESFERERLSELLLNSGLAHALRHPRDINRLINRIGISVPPTRGEVNVADVIAFEAISIVYPAAASAIRKRPYDFVGGWAHHDEPLALDYVSQFHEREAKQKSQELPEWRSKLWEKLSDTERRPLISLLDFLFPGFAGRNYERDLTENQQDRELRISRRDPLLKLLATGPVDRAYSVRDVKRFLQESLDRDKIINEIYSSDIAYGWLTLAVKFLDVTHIEEPQQMVSLLLDKAAGLGTEYRKGVGSLVNEMAFFVLHLLRRLPKEQTHDLLLWLAKDQRSLSLTHEVILRIAKEHKIWLHANREVPDEEKAIRDKATAVEAIERWLSAVREKCAGPQNLLQEPGALDILFRWGQLGEQSEVREFVKALTSTDKGVESFWEMWSVGSTLSGLDYFLSDWQEFRLRCERHPKRESFRKDLWPYFEALQQSDKEVTEEYDQE